MNNYPLIDESTSSLSMMSTDDRQTSSSNSGSSVLEKKTDFNILEKLKYLRDTRKYCDVVLEVRGVKFVAHKNVLASWSPVLGSRIFGEDPKVYKDHIVVYYDNSEVFSDLLDFMYNGYVAPRETNFLQLLHLAVSFQIETLKNYCEEFLRCNLHLGNFVSTYFLSRKFKLETLEEYIVGFLQLNLSDAVKQGEFLSLKAEKFNTFLSEGWMKKIKPEIKLFLIISWVGYDVQEREKYLVILLGHIDWTTQANDFLLEINRTENFFTTHESSLYLLLQTLYSAQIPLGPYKDIFPQLRESHSAILKEVVHTSLLTMETEEFNPITFAVKSRPFIKNSSVNTIITHLPCDFIETAINTDVNSLHFEESEKESQVAAQTQSTLIEEQPVVNENNRYEQFETLGDFIEAEIHEINQKEKERLTKEQQEEVFESLVDLNEDTTKTERKAVTPKKKSARIQSKKRKSDSQKEAENIENKTISYNTRQTVSDFSRENNVKHERSTRSSRTNGYPKQTEMPKMKMDNTDGESTLKDNNYEQEESSDDTDESSLEDELEKDTGKNKSKRKRSGSGNKQKKVKAVSPAAQALACTFDDCAYITKFPQRMERHIRCAHEASFELRCNLCQYETKEVRKYNKHMKEHFKGPPYKCDYPRCTYSHEKIQAMLTHRAIHSDERPYTCHCGMRFRTNNTLIAHKKVHLGKKEFTCPDCGVSFATRNTLSQHSVKHSDLRPYLCDLCGFSTKFQSHLIAHKRLHSGDVFKCQFPNCQYFTPKRSQLKTHMRAHLGIRAHVCETCGKTFIERSHLVRHEKLHSDKRLQCEKCEYNTPRKDKLKEHIKKYHAEGATPKPPKKAKVITTSKAKKSKPETEKEQGVEIQFSTPMVVKWDHGGYSLAQDSQDTQEEQGDGEPLLTSDGDYCVLRDQLGAAEPMQPILTIDQINASISAAKALEPAAIVGQASSPLTDGDSSLQTQPMTVITSNVPTLNLVTNPGPIDAVVNGTVVSAEMDTSEQQGQTYTIIQTSASSVNQQEYGGLSAFMALF